MIDLLKDLDAIPKVPGVGTASARPAILARALAHATDFEVAQAAGPHYTLSSLGFDGGLIRNSSITQLVGAVMA
jgi:hypothetical protein